MSSYCELFNYTCCSIRHVHSTKEYLYRLLNVAYKISVFSNRVLITILSSICSYLFQWLLLVTSAHSSVSSIPWSSNFSLPYLANCQVIMFFKYNCNNQIALSFDYSTVASTIILECTEITSTIIMIIY